MKWGHKLDENWKSFLHKSKWSSMYSTFIAVVDVKRSDRDTNCRSENTSPNVSRQSSFAIEDCLFDESEIRRGITFLLSREAIRTYGCLPLSPINGELDDIWGRLLVNTSTQSHAYITPLARHFTNRRNDLTSINWIWSIRYSQIVHVIISNSTGCPNGCTLWLSNDASWKTSESIFKWVFRISSCRWLYRVSRLTKGKTCRVLGTCEGKIRWGIQIITSGCSKVWYTLCRKNRATVL